MMTEVKNITKDVISRINKRMKVIGDSPPLKKKSE
jgi:CII-binding regulator of phage lambda lysogenization HflD